MKIKVIEPGWEGFTGDLGTVPFKDGVSLVGISPGEARALGSYVNVMEIDEAGNDLGVVNPALELLKVTEVSAPIVTPMRTLKEIQDQANAEREADESAEPVPVRTEPFTYDELEKIAEDGGISGLRAIATPMGIKGTAVKTLIAEILNRQPAV